ncbi:hypothetical protein D3C80_1766230 [compost metagenome]
MNIIVDFIISMHPIATSSMMSFVRVVMICGIMHLLPSFFNELNRHVSNLLTKSTSLIHILRLVLHFWYICILQVVWCELNR